jgi:hypothetical protein
MNSVYVLGAGSSVIAGGPLIGGFKNAARKTLGGLPPGPSSKQLREALDYWDKTIPNANIEEYYILADLMERLGFESEVQNTHYLIVKTLEDSMGTTVSSTHEDFFTLVYSPNQANSTTIISLNWDIALDRAVTSTRNLWGHYVIDYGVSNAESLSNPPIAIASGEGPKFPVFKLHGSTNWWFCKGCKTLWYATDSKVIASYWEGFVPKCTHKDCKGETIPLMVPPTSQKFEEADYALILSEIWKNARQALSNCNQLVFVGYSFPKTDIQFKMFVKEALSKNSELQKIAIITSPKYGSTRLTFENQYSDVFGDSEYENKLRFQYSTFENWVKFDKCQLPP